MYWPSCVTGNSQPSPYIFLNVCTSLITNRKVLTVSIHSSVSRHLSCSGRKKATVMHTNDVDKNLIRFKWRYPRPIADGEQVLIKFVYSVVQTFDTFWIAQQLGYLKITPGTVPEGATSATFPPSTSRPVLTSTIGAPQTTQSSAPLLATSTVASGQRFFPFFPLKNTIHFPEIFKQVGSKS